MLLEVSPQSKNMKYQIEAPNVKTPGMYNGMTEIHEIIGSP